MRWLILIVALNLATVAYVDWRFRRFDAEVAKCRELIEQKAEHFGRLLTADRRQALIRDEQQESRLNSYHRDLRDMQAERAR